ncbi:hypothetical protein BD410DRAFT_709506 [Rickenella mellea]|uniref:HIG1 domain-containing protein n=1 Tax=Rickenella mellea TaxID=50990 RepID=A0A4R5XES9_9AGAM|nr:hypothetical protein BD410DRAFT_709506 [Rickenella mellea]
MKVVSQEELEGHAAATWRGALEGTAASLAVGVPGSYFLHRRWPYFRSLPIPIKVLGVVLLWGPALAIQAERRGVEYDRAHWSGAGVDHLEREHASNEARWHTLSTRQKVGDWASRHAYSLLFGCWTATMTGSWILISRANRAAPFAHRIVQARVYAQGITVAGFLGASLLTLSKREEMLKHVRSFIFLHRNHNFEDNFGLEGRRSFVDLSC